LKSTDFVAVDSFKREELHVHLDVVAGDLFCIPARVNRSATYFPRQPSQAVSNKGAIDARTRGLYPVVALEIPGDSLRAEVIDAPEVKDFLDNLWAELAGVSCGSALRCLPSQRLSSSDRTMIGVHQTLDTLCSCFGRPRQTAQQTSSGGSPELQPMLFP
jgi:hypothetical protein